MFFVKNTSTDFAGGCVWNLRVVIFQKENGFTVALQAFAHNGLDTGHAGIGHLPEGLPLAHIGDMHFHGGKTHCFQSIQNGDGGMGIGGGVDDDAVKPAVGCLNLINDCAFVIGLKVVYFNL